MTVDKNHIKWWGNIGCCIKFYLHFLKARITAIPKLDFPLEAFKIQLFSRLFSFPVPRLFVRCLAYIRVGWFSKKFSKSSANEFGDTYWYPKLPQKIVARWLAHSAPDRWSKFYTSNLLNSHSSKTLTTDREPSVQASGPQFFVVTLGTHRYHQTRWQTILKTFWKIVPL